MLIVNPRYPDVYLSVKYVFSHVLIVFSWSAPYLVASIINVVVVNTAPVSLIYDHISLKCSQYIYSPNFNRLYLGTLIYTTQIESTHRSNTVSTESSTRSSPADSSWTSDEQLYSIPPYFPNRLSKHSILLMQWTIHSLWSFRRWLHASKMWAMLIHADSWTAGPKSFYDWIHIFSFALLCFLVLTYFDCIFYTRLASGL